MDNLRSVKISEALQIQIEAQRKLHEQIEVQRHLQLRIEAQGKYLQTVLRKAQETIAGYEHCSEAMEEAKSELSQLASMVSSGYQSSSISESTELNFKGIERDDEFRARRLCSIESSLTSLESSEEEEASVNHGNGKKRKGTEKEQSSSVFEGDFKRLMVQKSDEDDQEFRIIDLNHEIGIGIGSKLIEYL